MKLNFWTILKYFTLSCGALTILYGAFTLLDDIRDDVEDVQETVDHINVEQTWMAEDITKIQDTLAQFETEHKQQGQDIKTLTWGINHINDFDPEVLEDILNELLKKNYGLNPSPSYYRTPVDGNGLEDWNELGSTQ